MKKIIILFLCCSFFFSCDKIENPNITDLKIVQYPPAMVNGYWQLSGMVTSSLPMENITVGFYYNLYGLTSYDGTLTVDQEEFIQVEDVTNGQVFTATIPFSNKGETLLSYAIAMNGVKTKKETIKAQQWIASDPYTLSAKEGFYIELADSIAYIIKEKDTDENMGYVGVCWAEHENPTLADHTGYGFEIKDTVYVRGWKEHYAYGKRITTYSYNTIKLHPRSFIKHIYTEEDESVFLASDSYERYSGKLILHKDISWNYYSLVSLDCAIYGNGHKVKVSTLSEHGMICDAQIGIESNFGRIINCEGSVGENYETGVIDSCRTYRVGSNYGTISNTSNVHISNNYGIVKNCDWDVCPYEQNDYHYKSSFINHNSPSGKIIDCKINIDCKNENNSFHHYICSHNSGLIQGCTPWEQICEENSGLILK